MVLRKCANLTITGCRTSKPSLLRRYGFVAAAVGVSSVSPMNKKVWQLTEQDFNRNPVWYFPMGEDEEFDEENVLPANFELANDPNTLVVVAADFSDSKNQTYFGYIYWGETDLGYSQPCMYVNETAVTFWFGIVQPEWDNLPKVNFPITVVSRVELGLKPITINISGYGYLNEKYESCWVNC